MQVSNHSELRHVHVMRSESYAYWVSVASMLVVPVCACMFAPKPNIIRASCSSMFAYACETTLGGGVDGLHAAAFRVLRGTAQLPRRTQVEPGTFAWQAYLKSGITPKVCG